MNIRLPIILMVLIAPFTPILDFSIAQYFYTLGTGNVEHFVSNPIVDFIYDWGNIPAHIVFASAMILFFVSFFVTKWKKWRPQALLLILVLAVGAGFLTNIILKDHWGRPRPKQLEAFGGDREFRAFYNPDFYSHRSDYYKSFPCGHCTSGFFFLAFVAIGRRIQNRRVELAGWILGLGFGIILGLTRIAQGGHFLSDVLMGGLLMWLVIYAFDRLIDEEYA